MIIFPDAEDDEAMQDQLIDLKPAIERFKNDPVSFTYIKPKNEPYIHQEVFDSSRAVLYKPKRKKFMSLPVSTLDEFMSAIENGLGGGGTWNKTAELTFAKSLGKD